jgi:hypothetical protein
MAADGRGMTLPLGAQSLPMQMYRIQRVEAFTLFHGRH